MDIGALGTFAVFRSGDPSRLRTALKTLPAPQPWRLRFLLLSRVDTMQAIKNLLSPLASSDSNPIQDTLVCGAPICAWSTVLTANFVQKLVVIGGTVETARRASISAWNGFIDCENVYHRPPPLPPLTAYDTA